MTVEQRLNAVETDLETVKQLLVSEICQMRTNNTSEAMTRKKQ